MQETRFLSNQSNRHIPAKCGHRLCKKKKGEDHNCRKMTIITKTAPYDVKCRFEKEAISHQNI